MRQLDPSVLAEISALASAAQAELSGKEFFVTAVLDRARAASNAHPHDQAIRMFEHVLDKRASREGSLALISQAELSDLYNDLNGLGNREIFRDELGDLLQAGAPEKVASYNEQLLSGMRDSGTNIEFVSPNATEDLFGLFGEQSVAAARGSFVDNGRKGLEIELKTMGFGNPDIEVVARDQNFVIYAAAIDSSHGRVSAYVPAEVKLGTVLMPSVFVSGLDFMELTEQNLLSHAQGVAMGRRSAAPHDILKTLNKLAGKQEEIQKLADDGEFSIPMNVPELYQDSVEQPVFEVEQTKVAVPKELEHLTEGMIRDVLVEAGLSYDRDTVLMAKTAVATDLRTAGIQHTKISISSEFAGGLTVAANILGKGGHKTIEVPVEIINGRVLSPSVFISGAMAQPFDAPTLQSFAADEGSGRLNPVFSSKYGMAFKELHNLMLRNAAHGNFVEVEDALAVIADQYGPEYHRAAHDDLLGLLSIGYGEEERPLDAMDKYVKEASARARDKENFIHVQSTAALLYPGA